MLRMISEMGSNKISIGVGIMLNIIPPRRKSQPYNVSKQNLREKIHACYPFNRLLGRIAAENSRLYCERQVLTEHWMNLLDFLYRVAYAPCDGGTSLVEVVVRPAYLSFQPQR